MSSTAVQTSSTTSGEQYRRQLKRNVYDFPKVPTPIYRHAAPSAPWPWMKFDVDSSKVQPVSPSLSGDSKWCRYPQSLFPNWTWDQVNRSQMLTKCSDNELSTIFKIGVFDDGSFDQHIETHTIDRDDATDVQMYWDFLGIAPPSNVRVQALFVEDMTLPVVQMLGTKYDVEPFFFTSSVNWIPSMYEEDPKTLEDHITVVIPFVRTLKKDQQPVIRTHPVRVPTFTSTESQEKPLPYTEEERIIDTQVPLSLPNNKILVQDLLSLHMVRKPTTSTIISYHPSLDGTSAKRLQSLAHRTGDSVYWSNIYKRSKDPTFLFLAILWYALYAWDESFEVLFLYISALEHKVLQFNDIKLTRELHKLQAHLLYYQQLLRDYLRSVEFVRDSPSPALNAPSISEAEREDSAQLLRTEADTLISEIKRLTRQREMLSDRLENATQLTFATKRIEDTKARRDLREATMKDSASIKQISYLSMVFLPAAYLTNVFRMPVHEIVIYTEVTIVLTVLISWLAITVQQDSSFFPSNSGFMRRTFWPLFYTISTVKEWLGSAGCPSRHDTRSLLAFDEEQP
ncbi:hypothetical protein JVT61DRAFT_10181 [Boletus reticuloceps]|uniref:Uncharacterized protein n=1 Tax=Boletus reticuloceps TaxID=495285 RepID=A0A8I2YWA6_9AGAM|nr:hypothetical protein JVT61DRAFT_10181 [Boletus reticuloceps]